MEWIHEHACSEYMQTMVKVFMQMCTTILNKNNDNIVCNNMCTWWWVCAWILACKQFMVTFHGTTVVRLSLTMHIILCWWLYALKTWSKYMNKDALKTWSEYMNKDTVNTCKQWRKCRCTCLLQVCHKRKRIRVYNDVCTWWGVCAWILAWEQVLEHQSIGCRIRCRDIGIYMDWKHGVNTWTCMQCAVNTCKQWWKYSCKCVLQFLTKTTTI